MKEAFELIRTKLEEEIAWYETHGCDKTLKRGIVGATRKALSIVSEVEAEYGNGWITDRVPSKEECGRYGREWFLATLNANATTTLPMQYEYTTVRGKEVSRWLAYGRVSPWDVLAWMPLPSPYKPTTD